MEKELNNIYHELKKITKELQRLIGTLEHSNTDSLEIEDFAIKFCQDLKKGLA